MNWLVLSYFLSLGMLSYQGQVFDPSGSAMLTIPAPSYQTTLGFEIQGIDNHLFVGGSVQTWESPDGTGLFIPSEAFYIFSAGLRGWGFELGYRHECDHPIINEWGGTRPDSGLQINQDEFYLSFTGKLKVF
jgi:hypothetical protein